METYGIHEILTIKPSQIQWNLMGSWGFSNQIASNPMESYATHGFLAIKSDQTQ
jgi:hypothetical protein